MLYGQTYVGAIPHICAGHSTTINTNLHFVSYLLLEQSVLFWEDLHSIFYVAEGIHVNSAKNN